MVSGGAVFDPGGGRKLDAGAKPLRNRFGGMVGEKGRVFVTKECHVLEVRQLINDKSAAFSNRVRDRKNR